MEKIEKQGSCTSLSANGTNRPKTNLSTELFKPKGSSLEPFTVRFKENTLKAIREIAEDTGVSKAEVVRKSVNRVLKRLRGVQI